MHKIDKVAGMLGITPKDLFYRAYKGFGQGRDNPTSDFNRYRMVGTVPNYVDKFLVSELGKRR